MRIPFEYSLFAQKKGSRRPNSYIMRSTIEVDVPSISASETVSQGQSRVHIYDGRRWSAVSGSPGSFNQVSKNNYGDFLSSILLNLKIPFAIDNLPFRIPSIATYPTARDKLRTVSQESHFTALHSSDHDLQRRLAERDAVHCLWIDDILYSSAQVPVASLAVDRPRYSSHVGQVNVLNYRTTASNNRTCHLSMEECRDVMDGRLRTGLSEEGEAALRVTASKFADADYHDDLDTHFLSLEASALNLFQYVATSLLPHGQTTSILGEGSIGLPDIPEELDELIFRGRTISRKLLKNEIERIPSLELVDEMTSCCRQIVETVTCVNMDNDRHDTPFGQVAGTHALERGRELSTMLENRSAVAARRSTLAAIPSEDADVLVGPGL